ncbi:Alpha/Beta hydrolase protein [Xylogone sp. PMI_703]|nr:Alpha/Beta hydrolase protein [Xylogone sp. PMI_703]
MPHNQSIHPYTIDIPQSELDDLKWRLANTRWPDEELVSDWSQGVPLHKARVLCDYWQNKYDWRRFEREANALSQFVTKIDGLDIHFFHVRSNHPNALPVLLAHGWPGSFVEFMKTIKPLTDPTAYGGQAEDAFDVILPSLPGWGFTEAPKEVGWNMDRTARACITLMDRLGCDRWVAQGGDYGSAIVTLIAKFRPKGLIGIHLNLLFAIPERLGDDATAEEKEAMTAFMLTQTEHSGYKHESSTRPQTISYSLSDSPMGQATWIYEKFYDWTDNKGDPEDALSLDEMLDNISVYWFSRSAASSSRVFWEVKDFKFDIGAIDLPVAAMIFEKDIFKHPRKWIDRAYPNLIHFSKVQKGAHFGSFEQPELFVKDLRAAFTGLR